jgi:hypothetical protein
MEGLRLSWWFIANVDPLSGCRYRVGAGCITDISNPRKHRQYSLHLYHAITRKQDPTAPFRQYGAWLKILLHFRILFPILFSLFYLDISVYKPSLIQRFADIILQYNMDVYSMYSYVKSHYIQLKYLQVYVAHISF